MPEQLQSKKRKARKDHICSYCGEVIKKGTIYDWAKLIYEGSLYEWKNHLECGVIASNLWSYIDPDEGMTEEDFQEGCFEFCRTFICQGCEKYDCESDKCEDDKRYCIDKIYQLLQTHNFKHIKMENGWMKKWVLEEKK